MRKGVLGILIVTLVSYWAIKPIIIPGFFPMHDDTQVGRVVVMGRALRNGQFPVRWVSDLGYGYGYPIFNFYGPLPYYVGGSLYALGLTGLTATKGMFILGIILAGVSMYLTTASFLGSLGAIAMSVLYVYAPYHAVEVYVRGAVGEFWILIFLPLIVWGVIQGFMPSMSKKAMLVGGVGLAGAILSHTLLGYVTTLFLIFGLILFWLRRFLMNKLNFSLFSFHFSLLMIGLGLSAFFWLPALTEMHFTNVAAQVSPTANFVDHFVCPWELWNSPWGFGGSSPGCIDGLSFKLGKVHIVAALVGFLLWFFRRRERLSRFMMVALGITLVALFFTIQLSAPLWYILPGFTYLQYPWRFLTFTILGTSFLAGGLFVFPSNKAIRIITASVVIFIVVATNAKLFMPQYIYSKSAFLFETPEELRFRISKISDEYLPAEIERPTSVAWVPAETISATGSLKVETEIDTETYVKSAIQTDMAQALHINRAYFPGWHYIVNGKEQKPSLIGGLPIVQVPEGMSVVEMRFRNTPIRTIANFVSVGTLLLLLYFYGKKTNA